MIVLVTAIHILVVLFRLLVMSMSYTNPGLFRPLLVYFVPSAATMQDNTELNCSDDSSNSLTIRSDDSTEKCCEVPQM